MTKYVVFRCDSSYSIGFGHLKRCLNLANYLSSKYKILFICKNLKGNFIKLIKYKKIILNKFLNKKTEINFIEGNILKKYKIKWLIKDNYNLDFIWEKKIYQKFKNLFVIDDYTNHKHCCKRYLNQNYIVKFNKKNILNCEKFFIGPKYAIIPKFKKTKKNTKKVLIFFGGTDDKNFTLKFLKKISHLKLKFKFTILVGKKNKKIKEIKKIIKLNNNFYLKKQSSNFQKIIADNKFFIGSGGTTIWEMLKLNLNCMLISAHKNQFEVNKNLFKIGSAIENKFDKNFEKRLFNFLSLGSKIKRLNVMYKHTYGYTKFID
jgi:UDP-2,4-diacetamido-2,4,6-trideoxy-beta-L-altropyranose hydrolase